MRGGSRCSGGAFPGPLPSRTVRSGLALLPAAALTAALLVGALTPASAQTRARGVDDVTLREGLEAFLSDLEALRDRLGIPGLSAAVASDGRILWADGMGWADPGEQVPADAETPYRIASIAKPMTAVVVMSLARDGLLGLDAPVSRYLPAGPPWAESVTVRHLLSHTSEGPEPGEHFTYSGRYNALAPVVEAAAGEPLGALLVRRVFEPAGMEGAAPVSGGPEERLRRAREGLAVPHRASGEPAPPDALPDEVLGGNGVIATALDLVRFAAALDAGELLSDEARRSMLAPARSSTGERLPYAMGWFVETTPAVELIWHGGQWPFYSGLLLHVRDRALTLALLANSPRLSSPFYAIGTGTVLHSAFASAFLRRMVGRAIYGGRPPGLPVGASPDSLKAVGRGLPGASARYHYGTELLGRGMVAREVGEGERADALFRAAVGCCPESLEASADLGTLFHLGKSGVPEARRRGREAGLRRLARMPDDGLARLHLAVSYVQSGEGDRARPLLESLVEDRESVPGLVWGWSAYLLAEEIAGGEPERARELLEGVLEAGIDEGGLRRDARSLLESLPPG